MGIISLRNSCLRFERSRPYRTIVEGQQHRIRRSSEVSQRKNDLGFRVCVGSAEILCRFDDSWNWGGWENLIPSLWSEVWLASQRRNLIWHLRRLAVSVGRVWIWFAWQRRTDSDRPSRQSYKEHWISSLIRIWLRSKPLLRSCQTLIEAPDGAYPPCGGNMGVGSDIQKIWLLWSNFWYRAVR